MSVPTARTLATVFQRINARIGEHYEIGAHKDQQGNAPCEDPYCKCEPAERTLAFALKEAIEPLLFDLIESYDFSEHESFSETRERIAGIRKHQHECGKRMTSEPVVVEKA